MDTSNERATQGDQGATASADSFWRPVETPTTSTEGFATPVAAASEASAWQPVEPSAPVAEPSPWATATESADSGSFVAPPANAMTSAFGLTAPSFADPTPPSVQPVQASVQTDPPAPVMAAGLSGLSGFSTALPSVETAILPEPPVETASFEPAPMPSFSPTASEFPATEFAASARQTSEYPEGEHQAVEQQAAEYQAAEYQATEYQTAEYQVRDSSPAAESAAAPGFDPIGSGFETATPSWTAFGSESTAAPKPTLGALTAAAALLPTAAVEESSSRFARLKKSKASDEFGSTSKPAKPEKVKKPKKSKQLNADSLLSSRSAESELPPTAAQAAKSKRFSRGEKAPKPAAEDAPSEGSARRKFIVPGAMALVGLLGGGGYVLMSGGTQTAAPAVAVPAPEAASGAPSSAGSTESTLASSEVPPDLALTDPSASTDDPFGGDELEIEAPIAALEFDEPIPALAPETTVPATSVETTVPAADPASTDAVATEASSAAASEPAIATATDAAPVAAPVSAGRFQVASCVSVVGDVNDRTHRISNATITETDCAAAHNSEIVSKSTPDQNCETAVISFVGYPSRITQLDGTVVSFALVQDKSDGTSYCVASFPAMPDYTGQLYGSKRVQ
jgi:hypothetical protein